MKNIFSLIVAFTVVGCGGETTVELPVTEPSILSPVADVIQPEPPAPPAISIWDAARAGDIEAVREHVVLKVDPEASDEDRALRKAIARMLVRNGATAAKHK